MNVSEAHRAIEALRRGTPPPARVRDFTAGRKSEIEMLTSRLREGKGRSLLLLADHGVGKSHLLRLIRELALEEGYAVSSVTLDAKSAVRLNRMDQMLGAVLRGLEIPGMQVGSGLRPFMDLVCSKAEGAKTIGSGSAFWRGLTDDWSWGYSNAIESAGLFVAVRAWATQDAGTQDLVQDWLYTPWNYYPFWKDLYTGLIVDLRTHFRDPRSDRQFYANDVFVFNGSGYRQSWAALRDIHRLAREVGLKGLVILFDDFDDVVVNGGSIKQKEEAFRNLLRFSDETAFSGLTFFGLTPEAAKKCKVRTYDRGICVYDSSWFDGLRKLALRSLGVADLMEFVDSIAAAHSRTYNWNPGAHLDSQELRTIIEGSLNNGSGDRTRSAIANIVTALDKLHNQQGDRQSSHVIHTE